MAAVRIIAGSAKGRRLSAPRGEATRPTAARLRQSLFDILAPRTAGTRWLDVCAGSGAIGLEALSRGAAGVVFVERQRAAASAIRRNLERLAEAGGRGSVMPCEASAAARSLVRTGAHFDVVYLDPPYRSPEYESLLRELSPLLAADGWLVAEHFHKRELPETIGALVRRRQLRVGDHRLSFYARPEEP